MMNRDRGQRCHYPLGARHDMPEPCHGATSITDDRRAAKVARFYGLDVHGTVWLLAAACREGKLIPAGAGSLIDALRTTGHRLPCTGAGFLGYARQHGLL